MKGKGRGKERKKGKERTKNKKKERKREFQKEGPQFLIARSENIFFVILIL